MEKTLLICKMADLGARRKKGGKDGGLGSSVDGQRALVAAERILLSVLVWICHLVLHWSKLFDLVMSVST